MTIFGFIFLASCISSEESGANRQDPIAQEPVSIAPQSAQRIEPERPKEAAVSGQQAKQSKGARLTSRQDTLVASVTRRIVAPAPSARSIERPKDPAYTVQVGAFSKAQHALKYQKLAKERFLKNSVHNSYERRHKLYRVSVGKFTTRTEAAALRREVIKKYPKEYSQAWVNYLAK